MLDAGYSQQTSIEYRETRIENRVKEHSGSTSLTILSD